MALRDEKTAVVNLTPCRHSDSCERQRPAVETCVQRSMKSPSWSFTAYNVAGAILWTCAWGLGTYYLGRDVHVVAAFFHRHARLLYWLSATAFVALLVYLLRSRRVISEQ